MNNNIIILPVITQLIIIGALLFFWRKTEIQKWVSALGSGLVVAECIYLLHLVWNKGALVLHAGNWRAPFGISFVIDTFSATLLLLASISALAVSIYAGASVYRPRLKFGFFTIYHFLIMGIQGAFLTGDAFNLYVWFELMIISSFVLLSLGAEKKQLEATVKYFTLNFLASIIFLTGLGILYGLTGTLNIADISQRMKEVQSEGLKEICAIFFLVGFGCKAGLFPLYFWLPASYHTPPSAVSAIFGGLLTKVGVYAIIRMFSVVFADISSMHSIFLVLGSVTIVAGAIGAISQKNIMRVFGYLIICHIGYMIGGFGLFNKVALTGVVFYMIHDIVIKTNLFMLAGLVYKIKGSYEYKYLGNLYANFPRISLVAALIFFSLTGVPPLSGFWPKVPLLQSAFNLQEIMYAVCLIAGSIITLIVIARMWSEVFWKKNDNVYKEEGRFIYFKDLTWLKKADYLVPIVFLLTVSLFIGFGANYVFQLSDRIAEELMNPEIYYISKVLQ